MIRRLFCTFVCILLLCGCANAEDMNDLVRLHVLAENDTPEAQALKLELRNVCLRCAQACLSDAPDSDAAYMRLLTHLDDFENACVERARELGYEGDISAEAGRFDFPDRLYGELLVPAGEYRALRVTIGKGEGHNWWCILYPSLCIIDEATAAESDPKHILAWLRFRNGGVA